MTVANAASLKSDSLRPGCSDPLFQEECRQDLEFLQQVCALERMLRAATAGDPARLPGILEVLESDSPKHDKTARLTVTAGSTTGTIGLLEMPEARVAATAGESVGINGLHRVLESARSSLFHLHVRPRMVMSLVLLVLYLCLLLLVLLPCLRVVHSRTLVLLRMHVERWQ